ncbi:MAG: tetratricopeptide repeat protein [Cecembia sp.]
MQTTPSHHRKSILHSGEEKQDSEITYYLAMCYEQLEDYMAALEYLAASLEIDPRNASLNLEMIPQPHFLRQDVV